MTLVNALAKLFGQADATFIEKGTIGYRFGGEDWMGLDCSGLFYLFYNLAGLLMPRLDVGGYWDLHQAEPDVRWGDLAQVYRTMFWSDSKVKTRTGFNHMGVLVGENLVLEATSAGQLMGVTEPFAKVMERISYFDGNGDGILSQADTVALLTDIQAWSYDASDGINVGIETEWWNTHDNTPLGWYPDTAFADGNWSYAADKWRDTAKDLAVNAGRLAIAKYIADIYGVTLGENLVEQFKSIRTPYDALMVFQMATKLAITTAINAITGKTEQFLTVIELNSVAQTAFGVGYMDGMRHHFYDLANLTEYVDVLYLIYDASLISPLAKAMNGNSIMGVNLKAHTVRSV